MTLEKFLKQKRLDSGMTQQTIAKALRLESSQFVSNCERERCGWAVDHFPTLSKLLGVKVGEMVEMRGEDYKLEMRRSLGAVRGQRLRA